jgi:hypothetical protein
MAPSRQTYKTHAIQVLGHPQTRIDDRVEHIWFKLDVCEEDVVVHILESKIDYYHRGIRRATFPISRALMLVAMKRSVEESLTSE